LLQGKQYKDGTGGSASIVNFYNDTLQFSITHDDQARAFLRERI
jgi:hypothetical protein